MIAFMFLPEELQDYLRPLGCLVNPLGEEDDLKGAPVYLRDKDDVFLVHNFVLTEIKTFEKTALSCLYRGGALLQIQTIEGQVVIYDERNQWMRLVGGIARFNEGSDLRKTAVREGVIEEIAVLTDNERIRLVPLGMSDLIKNLSVQSWGIQVGTLVETGELKTVGMFFNDVNHAYEVVVKWDLSKVESALYIYHDEDWFKGGRSSFVPFVLNQKGDLVGLYDGRHGYVKLPVVLNHPTLQAIIGGSESIFDEC